MQFDAFTVRREGIVLPRFVFWTTGVRGSLFVAEGYDAEVHRQVRAATIRGPDDKVLLGPLLDVVLVSARPDWWSLTGWERKVEGTLGRPCAFQQSWVLIPAASADTSRSAGR